MIQIRPDDRWRRVPTFWLFAVQALAVLVVLCMATNDISFDVKERHTKPSQRLVRSLVCSVFSLLSIVVFTGLYVVGSLHPLLVVAANTVLAFWWLWVSFYQKIAMENLSGILRKVCPLAWKGRWLWCQNPKMEFGFSIISFLCCIAVVLYAAWTYKRTAKLVFDAGWMRGGFGWRNPRAKYNEVDLSEGLIPLPTSGHRS